MAYQRKTKDLYEVYGLYETGWEYLTAEVTMKEAKQRRIEYQENEHIPTIIKKRREKIKKDGEK